MHNFRPVNIHARDLDDAWYMLLDYLFRFGREYEITEGSYAGQNRLTFDFVSGFVEHPHNRPLAPQIPESSSLPPPTTDNEIEQYFANYLMNSELAENEDYRYATWITGGGYKLPMYHLHINNKDGYLSPNSPKLPFKQLHLNLTNVINLPPKDYKGWDGVWIKVPNQLQWIINHFKEKGHGNEHCYISVGYPESNFAYDIPYSNEAERRTSPCLRGLDFRIIDNYLLTHVIYRCLTGDTPLLIRIDSNILRTNIENFYSIYCGQNYSDLEVLGMSDSNHIDFVPVDHISSSYRNDIFRIEFSNASGINLSPDHRVFIEREGVEHLVQTRNLLEGDYFLEPVSSIINLESNDSFNLLDFLDKDKLYIDLNMDEINFLKSKGIFLSNLDVDKRHTTVSKIGQDIVKKMNKSIRFSKSKKKYNTIFEVDNNFSKFLGLWMSDGWFSSGNAIRLVVSDIKSELKEWVENYIENGLKCNISRERRSNCTVYNISDILLKKLLESFGFKHGSINKQIPNIIFNLSLSKRQSFIKGWLLGDGGSTCSENMAYDFIYLSKISDINFSFSGEFSKKVYFKSEGRMINSNFCYHLRENSKNTTLSNNKIARFNTRFYRKKIKKISNINQSCKTYDIAVKSSSNSFYCGAVPVKVHNSWDLVSGFPTNMGGFALLNEYIATEIGIQPGPLAFSCKSLHAYDHAYEYVKARLGK